MLDHSREPSNSGRSAGEQSPLPEASFEPYRIDHLAGEIRRYQEQLPRNAPPDFDNDFHAGLRQELIENLPQRSVLLLVGGRGAGLGDIFRQDSNFHYLTGFDHQDAVAILSNIPGKASYSLVVQPHDEHHELWDGKRPGPDGAIGEYGAEQAYDLEDLSSAIRAALSGARNLFLIEAGSPDSLNEKNTSMKRRVLKATRETRPKLPVRDGKPYLHEMRLLKAPQEIALLKQAAKITAAGHLAAMTYAADEFAKIREEGGGVNEGQVQAVLEAAFRDRGAIRPSFTTIVGAGKNGCTLHYNSNVADIRVGELVLVDAGAEYGSYAGDVTRTWPLSGKFTAEQKALHDLTCQAQEAAIAIIAPGVSMADVHEVAQNVIHEGLVRLGVLPSHAPAESFEALFPHRTSHFLGLDVHDVRGWDEQQAWSRPLEPSNVITVEPGIYISAELGRTYGIEPR